MSRQRQLNQRAGRARGSERLMAAMLAGAMVVGACSSGDDSDAAGTDGDDGEEGETTETTGPPPGAEVAHPTASGPVTGGSQGQPFNAMPDGLAENYGYVEEEYFLSGEAAAYEAEGELSEDGRWDVTEAGTAPYETRIVVRRPENPDDFDGTVFVEWLNVSGGVDADPDFSMAHPAVLSNGSAYVVVSAQKTGIEGGGGLMPIEGAEIPGLKQWDPERYGDLSHPGDTYSYDIYSQVAQALRRPGDVDVLDGLEAANVIAVGESQSAARMLTYVNAVHPVAGIYDGFLVHSRGAGGAPLVDEGSPIGEGVALVRDDIEEPVLQFETESDLFGVLGFHPARQDDSDTLRTWEVAGTAHADRSILEYNQELAADSGLDLSSMCGSINEGPQAVVLRAAFAALRTWVSDGEPPPEAPPFEVEGDAIARDEDGIALGGIRTPAVDAPIAVHSGEAPPDSDILCMLFGQTQPFGADKVAELYPTHQDYVDAVTESAETAVSEGFLLQADADELIAEAEAASVPE